MNTNRDKERGNVPINEQPRVRLRLLWATAILFFLAILAVWWAVRHTAATGNSVSFNQTIQPILSENCYACHGPDPGARKAGLRLDRAEFAFVSHEKYGPAIIRGNPDKSPLVRRIESSDPKERMPPPEARHTLKPEQIALLRRWVKEGAVYEDHWAFIPPKRSPVS